MINFLRVFLTAFTVTLAAAAIALFFYTERLHKAYTNTKTGAQTAFDGWVEQNGCAQKPHTCAEYSDQFESWMAQLNKYIKAKEQKPQFQYYLFARDLDEQHFSEFKLGGLASVVAASALLLLFVFIIVFLMGGKKKTTIPGIGVKIDSSTYARATSRRPTAQLKKTEPTPEPKLEPMPPPKPTKVAAPPDGNLLLNKAMECADTEPMQAISYLEQALEGSLGTKLSLHASLLCGSLRLKNKIGEDRGREQLQQIIASAPESEDAAKAKTLLETF